jgi:ACDE family multidrug resistance protein
VLAYSPLVLKLSPIRLGLVFFGWGLCLAFGSAVLSHRLERKRPPRELLVYGLILFILLLFLLFVVRSTPVQIGLIVLSGLVSGLNNALFTSSVMEVSPFERGVTSGAYNFIRWLGAAIAPVLSGVIGNAWAPEMPFAVAVVSAAVSVAILVVAIKGQAAEGGRGGLTPVRPLVQGTRWRTEAAMGDGGENAERFEDSIQGRGKPSL